MPELDIRRIQVGMLDTNCYLVSLHGRDDCVLVDPGDDPARIRRAMGGKKLAAILLTHGHFDHIAAVDSLMEDGTQLVIHKNDAAMLRDPVCNVSWMIEAHTVVNAAPHTVREGDTVEAAGMTFAVLHTPGHTPGCVCYACENVLFTGDTVMGAGCGRTDLPGGNEDEMDRSLARLAALRGQYTMLGGHG